MIYIERIRALREDNDYKQSFGRSHSRSPNNLF